MKRGWTLFWLSCKRQCRRPVFMILLILFPILMAVCTYVRDTDTEGIRIALYPQGDGFELDIARVLTEADSVFSFYLCETEEQLKADVAARKAECGYLLPEDLKKRLDSGRFNRCMTVYEAPSTVLSGAVNETVYAVLFEQYGTDILEQFVAADEMFAGQERDRAWEEIRAGYENSRQDGSTFSFIYETLQEKPVSSEFTGSTFPVREVAALWLLLSILYASAQAVREKRRGYYQTGGFAAAVTAMPCMTAISAAAAIWLCR